MFGAQVHCLARKIGTSLFELPDRRTYSPLQCLHAQGHYARLDSDWASPTLRPAGTRPEPSVFRTCHYGACFAPQRPRRPRARGATGAAGERPLPARHPRRAHRAARGPAARSRGRWRKCAKHARRFLQRATQGAGASTRPAARDVRARLSSSVIEPAANTPVGGVIGSTVPAGTPPPAQLRHRSWGVHRRRVQAASVRPGGAARAGSARRSAGLISESRLGPAGRSFGVCVLVMVYDMRPERGGSQRRLVVVLPVFRLGEGPRINSGVKCGAGVYARRGHAWLARRRLRQRHTGKRLEKQQTIHSGKRRGARGTRATYGTEPPKALRNTCRGPGHWQKNLGQSNSRLWDAKQDVRTMEVDKSSRLLVVYFDHR